jgi:hypothetical protein
VACFLPKHPHAREEFSPARTLHMKSCRSHSSSPYMCWRHLISCVCWPFALQGSGVFYAGYVLFQVPSNLILSRLGARTWLPFITAAWGTVATCCIFIKGRHTVPLPARAAYSTLRHAEVHAASVLCVCASVCAPTHWRDLPVALTLHSRLPCIHTLCACRSRQFLRFAPCPGRHRERRIPRHVACVRSSE